MNPTVRILIVDDEPAVRRALQRVLQREGREFFEAPEGQEGLEVLQRQQEAGTPVDVVCSDFNMPGGMGGQEFLRFTRDRYPATLRLLIADVGEEVAMGLLLEGAAHHYVGKPWNTHDLRVNLQYALCQRARTQAEPER